MVDESRNHSSARNVDPAEQSSSGDSILRGGTSDLSLTMVEADQKTVRDVQELRDLTHCKRWIQMRRYPLRRKGCKYLSKEPIFVAKIEQDSYDCNFLPVSCTMHHVHLQRKPEEVRKVNWQHFPFNGRQDSTQLHVSSLLLKLS